MSTDGKLPLAFARHPGDYDDAIRSKSNLVVLFFMETTGAISPPTKRHLRWLQKRADRNNGNADRTRYEGWAARTRGTPRNRARSCSTGPSSSPPPP